MYWSNSEAILISLLFLLYAIKKKKATTFIYIFFAFAKLYRFILSSLIVALCMMK